MPAKAFGLCYLVVAMVVIAGPFPLAAESNAVPGSISWGSWDVSASTEYGVYNSDNATPLQPGCSAQLIWTGPDRQIDPPMDDGSASADDQILDTSTVVANDETLPRKLWNLGYLMYQIYTYELTGVEDPRFAGVIYIRAWNAPTPGAPAAYGDSQTGILAGAMGQQWKALRWYTPNVPLAVDLAYFTATAERDHVQLAWETVSEIDHLGFNIYRAIDKAGPWTKVNATLIPAQAPGSSEGHAYTWTDAAAMPGTTWYQLEDMLLNGTVTRHDPVCVTVAGPNAVGLARYGGATTATWPAVGLLLAVAAAAAVARRMARSCGLA